MNSLRCEICATNFESPKKLSLHFRYKHNISSKQYYDTFLKKAGEELCQVCNSASPFRNITDGYFKTCCKKCSNLSADRSSKILQTKILKYGTSMSEIYEKQKNTVCNWSEERKNEHSRNLSNGIKQSYQNDPERTSRMLETRSKKYDWSSKAKEVHKNRTKEEVEKSNQKRKQTCLTKYGVEYFAGTKQFKDLYQKLHAERSLEEKQQIIQKTIETKVSNNVMLPLDHPDRLNKSLYKNKCRVLSEHWAQIKFSEEDLNKRGLNGTAGALQLDHIVSLETCFRQGIPKEISSHYVNLRLITWEENIKKKAVDHMSIQQLIENFLSFDHSQVAFAISKGEKFK